MIRYTPDLDYIEGYEILKPKHRLKALGEAIQILNQKGYNIELFGVEDFYQDMRVYNWETVAYQIIVSIPEKITHIFGSEPEYKYNFETLYEGSEYILIDPERENVRISATEIRESLVKNHGRLYKDKDIFNNLLDESKRISNLKIKAFSDV